MRRFSHITNEYDGERLRTTIDGRKYWTPMLIVFITIGTTDVMFAFDSIPAIFGLTKDPFIVFTSNVFALLGLQQLYFLLGRLLDKLVYLPVGLSLVLGFIGVKLILEALHGNTLPFINHGQPLGMVPEVPTRAVAGGHHRLHRRFGISQCHQDEVDRREAGRGTFESSGAPLRRHAGEPYGVYLRHNGCERSQTSSLFATS